MKFTVDSFYKTMLRPIDCKPFLVDLKYIRPHYFYDWTDYKEPAYLVRLKFCTLLDKLTINFDFCEDDFIEPSVFTKFDLNVNCNKELIELLNFNSNSPTMQTFKFYLQKQCLTHVFSENFTLPSLFSIENTLNGTKKQIREIVDYFDRHQTTSFRVCCNMTHPYNKGCFLVVNDDLNTLFSITAGKLDNLLGLVVKETNQSSINL